MSISASPESFADALDALDALIPTATKQYLLALDEAGLQRDQWGLGIAIRNVLGLGEGSRLAEWFRARGVSTAAEMGDEILRAYWRRLRGLDPEGRAGEAPCRRAGEGGPP